VLDEKLIDLLKSLTPDEWQQPTIARLWKVRDVAAHLLDGNIRVLSILRDGYWGEQPDIKTSHDLIDFLNSLNAGWVKAMNRVSPGMLISLLEVTGPAYCDYLHTLKPFDKSVLAVDWAGESESMNWMEIARQYTEKWLHQQQIRDAVNRPGLMTRELFFPFIDIFMLALPHTYRSVQADNGTVIKITVTSEIGGIWFLNRIDSRWILSNNSSDTPAAEIVIDPGTAWKLYSKSLRPEQVKNQVEIHGDRKLGEIALTMVSVMA
jgi:uncharacterized protein (TIGR03083 family)